MSQTDLYRIKSWLAMGLLLLGLFYACPALGIDLRDPNNTYDYIVIYGDGLSASDVALFPPLHPGLRFCIVSSHDVGPAFPDGIRSFLQYAYTQWRIAPQYVLLIGDQDFVQVHLDYNPFYGWNGLRYFSNDGYYVTSPVSGQLKPIMHIGRIPARFDSHISNVASKIASYQASGQPAWQNRILMLVGDARFNEYPGDPPNATYRTLNDELRSTEFAAWPASNITTFYAQDYVTQSDAYNTQVTRDAWNSGYGLVNALGNTRDVDWLTFMAGFNLPCYDQGNGSPTFTESLASTGRTPVMFANTCFTNWFTIAGSGCQGQSCIGSDLLMSDATKGAVAIVGPTHQADMVETFALNRTFVHEMITNGVRNIGRLYSTAKSQFITQNQGHAEFANEYALLGDPAMELKLGPLPTPTAYASSMEIEDAPILQDVVTSRIGDISGDNLRLVNQGTGVIPLAGERMLQVRAHDGFGAPGAIEWKLQDFSLAINQNMILSFWMNLQSSPSGNGKLVVDANTSLGRLKDRLDVFTQDGVPLDAKRRLPAGPGWKFYYADLSPLSGATLQDLRLRYESTSAADSGSLVAYIDDIRVNRYESVNSQELVNHSFEEDEDGNGTPDFWTDVAGQANTPNALRSNAFSSDGKYSLVVQDTYDNGSGASQVFTANIDGHAYIITLNYLAPDPTTLKVRVRDLETGAVAFEMPVNATNTWQTASNAFFNPYAGVRPARFSLELLPQDPSRPVYVDNVQMYPLVLVGIDETPNTPRLRAPRLLAVTPNPVRVGSTTRLSFELPSKATVQFGVFDAAGRSIGSTPAEAYGAGGHSLDLLPGTFQSEMPSGLCFIRMRVNGAWTSTVRKAVVLR